MGTRATLSYSSTYGVSSATEEYEPLGQKINNWDPSGDDDPPPGTPEPIGSASDPEWQCNEKLKGFWGGFSGMPWHCQKKALMEAGSKLPWEDEVSVKYIVKLTDSPLPKFNPPLNDSPSDRMLTYAVKATAKKNEEDKKKKCPVENGEAQCEQVAAVETKIPQAPEIPNDFRGADVGIVEPTIAFLRQNLETLLQDENCALFINTVRKHIENIEMPNPNDNSVKYEGSLLDNFDRIKNNGMGFRFSNQIVNRAESQSGKITFSTKYFSLSSNTVIYEVDQNNYYGGSSSAPISTAPIYKRPDRYEISENLNTTLLLVHELIHYSYQDFGHTAAHDKFTRAVDKTLKELGIKSKLTSRKSGSDLLHATLLENCGKVKL